jgi:tRNA A37 threonylcarbamoyladenosine biosynthesis protein TsaE
MRFQLKSLTLKLKRETVIIPFADITYFYGQMGAGKTSIARLIDYCLGATLTCHRHYRANL